MDMDGQVIDIFGKPSFYKILLGNFFLKLRIPPNFLKYIQRDVSTEAILKGPVQGSWLVKISRNGGDMYFQDGWEMFLARHTLREHDFLVFTYFGGIHFYVHIFERSACEVKYTNSTRILGSSVVIEENGKKDQRKNSKPATQQKNYTGEGTCSLCGRKDSQPTGVTVSEAKHSRPNRNSGGNIVLEGKRKRRQSQGSTSASYISKGNEKSRAKKAKTFYVSSRRLITEADRANAWEKAKSFKSNSNSPCVMIRMLPSAVYTSFVMHLHHTFSWPHLPSQNTQVILEDPNGISWEVRYIVSNKEKRGSFSAGWRAFSLGNCLEEGDVCVFELVESLKLKVHIYRVVKKYQPLIKG